MRLPTALCLLFTTAIAAPVPPKQEVLHNEKTTCATIDTYTVQYFIDNVVPTKRPPSSTCLFYTWGLTEKARLYAQTHGKTTIWDIWPDAFYQDTPSDTNPLHCIMRSDSHKRTYFANMSTAFASLCDIYALVMDANVSPRTASAFDVGERGRGEEIACYAD
ncbi:hypothetical protein GRF29_19g406661 [Pseudopithomyces chartarum]|uniref:Uncharacterized protein n=1 Tax=Pseudopithomyces chartarum TaxID=1892770 RepID=A0AAN6M5K4_9PLEO|nr:hypothetical protein GRF29_19g406661 [Pseudopithomyces chartarum]